MDREQERKLDREARINTQAAALVVFIIIVGEIIVSCIHYLIKTW